MVYIEQCPLGAFKKDFFIFINKPVDKQCCVFYKRPYLT